MLFVRSSDASDDPHDFGDVLLFRGHLGVSCKPDGKLHVHVKEAWGIQEEDEDSSETTVNEFSGDTTMMKNDEVFE